VTQDPLPTVTLGSGTSSCRGGISLVQPQVNYCLRTTITLSCMRAEGLLSVRCTEKMTHFRVVRS